MEKVGLCHGRTIKNCYFSHYSLAFNVIQRVVGELWKQLHFNQQMFLFLFLLSSHVHCLEANPSTQAITQAINNTSNEPNTSDALTTSDVPLTFIKNVIDNVPFAISDKHKNDDDDDDDDKKEKKKKHKKKKKHDKDDDTSNTMNPTTTIYSTIYIIATETPTQIYTGTNQPAKQKGQKSDGNEVSDPSASQSTGYDGDDDDDDDDDDADSDSQTGDSSEDNNSQANSGHSTSYKRLVAALSVVGSLAGITLFIVAFVFARRQVNKNKHHPTDYPKDLEMGPCSLLSPPPPPPHRHIPPPPPSLRHSSYRINISQHHDGDSTLFEFGNPFNDPTEEKHRDSIDLTPELPVNLNPEHYIDFRQNQTLSLLSQTAAAEPSAPLEKELNDNPFEQQDEIALYYPINQIYPTEREQRTSDNTPLVDSNNQHQEEMTSLSHQQQQRRNHSRNQGNTTDLPPAYTPSAIPSAPPLYALPTISQLTEMRRNPSIHSSRRHSVSSSILSESRSLSLRRGSGSLALAFISSPFS